MKLFFRYFFHFFVVFFEWFYYFWHVYFFLFVFLFSFWWNFIQTTSSLLSDFRDFLSELLSIEICISLSFILFIPKISENLFLSFFLFLPWEFLFLSLLDCQLASFRDSLNSIDVLFSSQTGTTIYRLEVGSCKIFTEELTLGLSYCVVSLLHNRCTLDNSTNLN